MCRSMRSTVEYPGIVVGVSVSDHTCFRWVCCRKRMSKICLRHLNCGKKKKCTVLYGFPPVFVVKLVVFSRFIFISGKMSKFSKTVELKRF
jgi:hypothetical protein